MLQLYSTFDKCRPLADYATLTQPVPGVCRWPSPTWLTIGFKPSAVLRVPPAGGVLALDRFCLQADRRIFAKNFIAIAETLVVIQGNFRVTLKF